MIRALRHGCRLGVRSTCKASSPVWSVAPAAAAPRRRQLSVLGHIGDDRKGALRAAFDESKGRLKGMVEQGKAPAIPSLRAPPGPAAAAAAPAPAGAADQAELAALQEELESARKLIMSLSESAGSAATVQASMQAQGAADDVYQALESDVKKLQEQNLRLHEAEDAMRTELEQTRARLGAAESAAAAAAGGDEAASASASSSSAAAEPVAWDGAKPPNFEALGKAELLLINAYLGNGAEDSMTKRQLADAVRTTIVA